MSWKRTWKLFVAGGLAVMIALGGIEVFFVRDLLAALLMFCTLLVALGMTVLVSFLFGEVVVRCFGLLAACAASFRLHRAVSSVVDPLAHGIGKS